MRVSRRAAAPAVRREISRRSSSANAAGMARMAWLLGGCGKDENQVPESSARARALSALAWHLFARRSLVCAQQRQREKNRQKTAALYITSLHRAVRALA